MAGVPATAIKYLGTPTGAEHRTENKRVTGPDFEKQSYMKRIKYIVISHQLVHRIHIVQEDLY